MLCEYCIKQSILTTLVLHNILACNKFKGEKKWFNRQCTYQATTKHTKSRLQFTYVFTVSGLPANIVGKNTQLLRRNGVLTWLHIYHIACLLGGVQVSTLNTLRPRQNGRHFADNILMCIFLNENVWIPIEMSLKFVPKGPISNIPALVEIMDWGCSGDKPLSEPMMVRLPTHICVTRPQWVNYILVCQVVLTPCGVFIVTWKETHWNWAEKHRSSQNYTHSNLLKGWRMLRLDRCKIVNLIP